MQRKIIIRKQGINSEDLFRKSDREQKKFKELGESLRAKTERTLRKRWLERYFEKLKNEQNFDQINKDFNRQSMTTFRG